MKDYKYRPLDGLLEINREEIKNTDIVSAFDYAEEKIASIPNGRTKDLAVIFHLIKIMKAANLNFYVKGGVILQYYLKDKARVTHDIDRLTIDDGESFLNKVKDALKDIKGPLTYVVKEFRKEPANEHYYYDTFTIVITALNNGEPYSELAIDGVTNKQIYEHIIPKTYKGPSLVDETLSFKGVPIEFEVASKIIAITNELERPYKHLVDAYSLIHINMCIGLVKEYLDLIINSDNQIRSKYGKEINNYVFKVRDDKRFIGTKVLPSLQAGYVLSFEEIKDEVNKWMEDNL